MSKANFPTCSQEVPLCCEHSLYASFTSNFSKRPFLAEGALLETVHGTVNKTGVGGQTQCSRTLPGFSGYGHGTSR